MSRRYGWIGMVVLLAACGKPKPQTASAPAEVPSRRQLDSAVARMPVPGAKAVDRALGVVEASQARAAAMDSIH
jgi:hypothetical protein